MFQRRGFSLVTLQRIDPEACCIMPYESSESLVDLRKLTGYRPIRATKCILVFNLVS